jgi:hypothetical protein
LLALDDWNKLTLSVRADGMVALCLVADGKAQSCDTAPEPTVTSPEQKIYLRISQSSAGMIGAVSADGVKWTQIGVWGIPWLPTAEEPLLGAYAPPVAPVSIANSGVAPSAYAATPLTFTSLSLFVEGANTRSASGVSAQFNAITVAANTNAAP